MTTGSLKIKCPTCERKLKIPRKSLRKEIICPHCGAGFRIDGESQTMDPDATNELAESNANGGAANSKWKTSSFDDIDQIVEQISQTNTTDDSDTTSLDSPNPTAGAGNSAQSRGPRTVRELESQAPKPEARSTTVVKTKQEKSLGNNGTGLLILAFGICLIPFAAGNVIALRNILWLLPILAVGLAFIGCFMLAYSRRRENIESLILACLPLLIISVLGVASHYYTKHLLPDLEDLQAAIADPDAPAEPEPPQVVIVEQPEEIDDSDRLTFNPDSITNNPASRFAPKPAEPVDNDHDTDSREIGTEPSTLQPETGEKPTDKKPFIAPDEEIAKEMRNALLMTGNENKFSSLQSRLQNDLRRGSVNRGEIRQPAELKKYKLSEIAGRDTVFGLAYYSHQPVVGMDIAERSDRIDGLIDIVAPIIDFGQFKDSMVAKDDFQMVGLNVYAADDGIRGLQTIFSDGQHEELSGWAGADPQGGNYRTLQVTNSTVHGVVVYRDKLSTVGLQLIVKPRPKRKP